MTTSDCKIIVLTPVKNEEWILHQFLTITSFFADYIIIADQNSTDESKNICKQFSKVYIVQNRGQNFNESERQILLIQTARKLFPDKKRILIALDADEILTAESLLFKISWDQIRNAVPASTIYFEKPDILPGMKKCIRYNNNYFPLGYIDDGIEHNPKAIHSRRIPENPAGQNLYINDIKFMHFAHARKHFQSSKLRYYSAVENIKKTNPLYLRRYTYPCRYNENKFYAGRTFADIPGTWLDEWDKKKINLKSFKEPQFSWYDFEVLCFFKQYGYEKFHFDNIWCFEWENCRRAAIEAEREVPTNKIIYPGFIKHAIAKVIDWNYKLYRRFKKN